MDVLEAIYSRRAVRAYTEQRVESTLVMKLIDAAIRAPSAFNTQPWAFGVIQDAAWLRRLSDEIKAIGYADMPIAAQEREHIERFSDPSFDVFHGATTLIVICSKPTSPHPTEDCALAGQNLMLAAHALGLGTCAIGFARHLLRTPGEKRRLGIPDENEPVLPIVVGYPRGQAQPTPREEPLILFWK